MNAVRVHRLGDIHIVVDNKGNLIPSAKFLDLFCFLQEPFLIQILLPELDEGNPSFQSLFHLVRQPPASKPAPVCHCVQQ